MNGELLGNQSQELIPITEMLRDGRIIQTVDARDLHTFLGSKRQFSDWIKTRLDYGFKENVDYWVFHASVKNSQGGRPTTEYRLTLSMGKELAMVENNDQGRLARQYFIECERRYFESSRPPVIDYSEEIKALRIKNLNAMAEMSVYPESQKAQFRAEAASLLSGNSMSDYLPLDLEPSQSVPVVGTKYKIIQKFTYSRNKNNSTRMFPLIPHKGWLTIDELAKKAEYYYPQSVQKILRSERINGPNDPENKYSEPFWEKKPKNKNLTISYRYDPDFVMPYLMKYKHIYR
jgi:phage anti-repressor protein